MRLFPRGVVGLVLVAVVLTGCGWWPFNGPAGPIRPVFGFGTVPGWSAAVRSTVTDGAGRESAVFFFMTPLLTGFESTDGYSAGDYWTVSDGLPIDTEIKVTVSLEDDLVVFTGVPVDPTDESLWIRVTYDELHSEFSIEQCLFFGDPLNELEQGASTAFIYFKGNDISVSRQNEQFIYHDLVDVGVFFHGTDPDTGDEYGSGLQFRQNEIYHGPLEEATYGVVSLIGDTRHITDSAEFPDLLGGFKPSGIPDVSLFDQYAQYFAAYSYGSSYLAPFAYYCIEGATPVAIEPFFSLAESELTEAEKWQWFHDNLPDGLDDVALLLPFDQ